MSRFSFAQDSKYFSTHNRAADTNKSMKRMKTLIREHAVHFVGLPYEAAIGGKLNGQIVLHKGELEERAPPLGEPMGCRTDADRDALKRYVLLYVDMCARKYNGRPNSLINAGYASVVGAFFEMGYISFKAAEELLVETLKEDS